MSNCNSLVLGFCAGFTAILTFFNWLRLIRIERILNKKDKTTHAQ